MNCIYCREEKQIDEFSLEHVVPQFLGGNFVSDKFKTRNVCKKCNNNLGLFVDAAFEKDWLVFNYLKSQAHAFFNPKAPTSLPLHYMGHSAINPPHMVDGEICECWLGPLGEQIFWIRPDDEKLYWYAGGNPRTVKKQKTRAYFIFAERSLKNFELALLSFKDAFEGKPVKKIMCTRLDEENILPRIGFSNPDDIDQERIGFFLESVRGGKEQHCKYHKNVFAENRFIAKLALGILHCLFNKSKFSSEYMEELYKGLWYRTGDNIPKIPGSRALHEGKDLKRLLGVPYGTTISILKSNNLLIMNLNIGTELNYSIQCGEIEELDSQEAEIFDQGGLCIVIYKPLQRFIELGLYEFIAHKSGDYINDDLSEIESMLHNNEDYFKNL
ncbi:HNH endonuclease [Necropsobacter massiliensis]|uniref:HNH endonuclease n=1 Tax=Necropsobacter massiliensis TaxID=1400001 RepID=UPI0005960CA1|nr:HNH endonuclease [Necropsobacter massiliensis]